MEWIKGQEKGAEPGEEQKAVMRTSVQWSNPPRVSKQTLEQLQLLQRGIGPFPLLLALNPSLPTSTGAKSSSTIPSCAHKSALSPLLPVPIPPMNTARVCLVNLERDAAPWPKTLRENPVNLFDELPPAAGRRIKADWLLCSPSP